MTRDILASITPDGTFQPEVEDAIQQRIGEAISAFISDPNSELYSAVEAIVVANLNLGGNSVAAINTAATFGTPTASTNLTLAKGISNQAAKYLLNTWIPSFASGTANVVPSANSETAVRRYADAALGLAAALGTGAYDNAVTGVTAANARAQCRRLVAGLAGSHKANGSTWGGTQNTPPPGASNSNDPNWQAALWASRVAFAAWLTQADLTATERAQVGAMVVWEADRVLAWTLPYWKTVGGTITYAGDTKADEVAWNAGLLVAALTLMPSHVNAPSWMAKLLTMGIAAYSRPADLNDGTPVNGLVPSQVLGGSNITDDGLVINHSIVHPDYMTSGTDSLWGYLTILAAAGLPVPGAAFRNARLVWRALSTRAFTTGETIPGSGTTAASPGGVIYKTDGSFYFPNGNDHGTSRVLNFAQMDLLAQNLGWDSGLATSASTWAQRHLQKQADLQARSTTGQTYISGTEDTGLSPETWVAAISGLQLVNLYAPTIIASDLPGGSLVATSRAGAHAPIDPLPVPPIASFTASPSSGKIVLSWTITDTTSIDHLTLARGATQVFTGNDVSYTDTGVTNGTSYTYTLTLIDTNGQSYTATTSATPAVATDMTTGLLLKYSAASVTGVSNGGVVSSLADTSGNAGPAMTQATTAAKPTLKTAGVNGKPTLVFDGTDDVLADTTYSRTSGGETLVMVAKYTGGVVTSGTSVQITSSLSASSPTASRHQIGVRNGGAGNMWAGNYGTPLMSTTAPDTGFHTLSASQISLSPTGTVTVDGAATTGTIAPATTQIRKGISLGATPDGLSFAACEVAEVRVYDHNLSSAELAQLRAYFTDQYGTP